jgi:DNA ligase (NAD+)
MSTIIKLLLKSDDYINFILNLSIEELEECILYANEKYYNTDINVLSDEIYDIFIDTLKLKDSKSIILKSIGALPSYKNKIKLDYWLGSMNKIKPFSKNNDQLKIWKLKYDPPYNLSDKLDGISALLIYSNKKIKMYTRGTAIEGLDISHLIKYIDLPSFNDINIYCKKNKINGEKNLIAFRGELIFSKDKFTKWNTIFKNSRNCVAGIINSKNINPELVKDIELVLYEIVDPFYDINIQFNIIKELNFKLVHNKNITNEITYDYLSTYFKKRRDKSKYQIDGIIVTSIKQNERNISGNPEYAFAFKDILEEQKSITTVLKIEWNISKHGTLIPVLILEPIIIGSVEIKRVTGHNAKFIVDNKLGKGAILEIIRSGDVIPYINKIIKKSLSGEPDLPTINYHWNESNVDFILDNKDNDKVIIKNIYFFFSHFKAKGIGEKVIEKLVNSKYNTIYKILTIKKEELLQIEGIKEKSSDNFLNTINKLVNNISLDKLMTASNTLGEGIGYEKIKNILSIYPNILNDYNKWNNKIFIEKIKAINGIEERTATLFVSNFNNFINFYNSIKDIITIISNETIPILSELTNKIIVFTGFRDNELQKKIEELGGIVSNIISKKCNYLIVKNEEILENPTDKINKALELNIKIYTKLEFYNKFII